LGAEKLAIETDSPILQSIFAVVPPPLFRVLGVMDWEFNLLEKQKENINEKYQSIRQE
jgi:hypothetical protein